MIARAWPGNAFTYTPNAIPFPTTFNDFFTRLLEEVIYSIKKINLNPTFFFLDQLELSKGVAAHAPCSLGNQRPDQMFSTTEACLIRKVQHKCQPRS